MELTTRVQYDYFVAYMHDFLPWYLKKKEIKIGELFIFYLNHTCITTK